MTPVSYAGGKSAVSALLFEAQEKRGPALLFLHWGFGDRFSFAREAVAYARHGVTCLTIDAPGMGARGKGLPQLDRAEIAIPFLRECLDDLKAGVDFLVHRESVDPLRVGYVGHSLGGSVAGQFAAAEPRLAAAVVMAGPGRLAPVWSIRPTDSYATALQPFDGERVIGASKAKFLFQVAERDAFVAEDNARSLYDAAPDAKTFKSYQTSHALNGAARVDRAHWLANTLGFSAGIDDAVWRRARLPMRDLVKCALIGAAMSATRRR